MTTSVSLVFLVVMGLVFAIIVVNIGSTIMMFLVDLEKKVYDIIEFGFDTFENVTGIHIEKHKVERKGTMLGNLENTLSIIGVGMKKLEKITNSTSVNVNK